MLKNSETLEQQMDYLKLHYMAENYDKTVQQALKEKWSHIDCLSSLVAGEAAARWDRSTQRRITMARFPVIKTVEQFKWSWPTNIDRLGIKNLFHLKFIANKENIIFIGSVGVGKSHLATALGYAACLKGHSVLFTTAIDVINAMSAAKTAGRLKTELKRYLRPEILILDELGYLPIDKHGAIKRAEVMDLCRITKDQAYKLLKRLKNSGQVVQVGERKGAVYERTR